MKTTTFLSNCLSFEQLQAYSSHTTNRLEHEQLYMHISSCELCASAINGFSSLPFSFDDLANIHHKIDVKTNASHVRPLTFTHLSIVIISLISIIGFYKWVNIFSEKKAIPSLAEKTQPIVFAALKTVPVTPAAENNDLVIKKTARKIRSLKNNLPENSFIPIKEIESIPVNLNEPSITDENDILKTNYNADVIYIYDLKVSDYTNLYFNHTPQTSTFKGHTPSYKENKENLTNSIEKEETHSIPANKVLKQGLEHFNKGEYSKAISSFQMLLENNPDDINALFYGALSLSQIGRYNAAINYLYPILENPNNAFYEEAKWNLALLRLKTGEQQIAKQLLKEIEIEKGFYSKKAQEKLNGL